MCDPVSLTIAATAVTVGGKVAAGVAAHNQAAYESKVATQNQTLSQNAAADALERGRITARDQYRRNAAIAGEQAAAQSANGIDVSFGSAVDLAGDTAQIGSENALTVRENANREARGYSIQAANYGAQAYASKKKASGALVATAFDVGSTILGGASQVSKLKAGGY